MPNRPAITLTKSQVADIYNLPSPTIGATLIAILFAATGGLLIAGSFALMLAAICGGL